MGAVSDDCRGAARCDDLAAGRSDPAGHDRSKRGSAGVCRMGGTMNAGGDPPSAVVMNMPPIIVDLPRVHVAGSDAHHNAHLEVGPHGFALFLSPDAEYPFLDIDGTPTQLDDLVRALNAALMLRASETPL